MLSSTVRRAFIHAGEAYETAWNDYVKACRANPRWGKSDEVETDAQRQAFANFEVVRDEYLRLERAFKKETR